MPRRATKPTKASRRRRLESKKRRGGIKALRALAGPFPDALICPTGGIGEANAASWLGEPNVVAVGGSWLCPAADVRSGNWAGITAICQRTMKSLKPA